MASENGKRVAQEVKRMVGEGRLVNKVEAQKKVGYSDESARAHKGVMNDGYKQEMEGFVDKLEKEVNRIHRAIESKDLTKEEYRDLVKSLDIYVKNIQLLGGKPTEISKMSLTDLFFKANGTDNPTGHRNIQTPSEITDLLYRKDMEVDTTADNPGV